MDSETLKIYTTRITQANKSELVVIIYEIILEGLEQAKKDYEEKDINLFIQQLKKTQQFLNELIVTLDFRYKISSELLPLYLYVNKCILTAIVKRDSGLVDSAQSVMKKLYIAFKEVAKEDHSEAIMQNTQQVYAGLTYGKGTLNETLFDPNGHTRGFKA